jgi:hypothetical protein
VGKGAVPEQFGASIMKKSVLLFGFAAVVAGVGLLGVARQAQGQSTTHKTPKTGKTVEAYTVVQIIGENENGRGAPADPATQAVPSTYKVIRSSALKDEKKRIDDENKKAKDEFSDEVKINPSAKRPVTIKLTVVRAGFKTQKVADEYVAQLKEKEKEKEEGKDATETGDTKAVF